MFSGKWYCHNRRFPTGSFSGAVSTIEGIVDMAASVVGAFGDENFKKKGQDFIKTDFTGTYIAPLVKKHNTDRTVFDYRFARTAWSV